MSFEANSLQQLLLWRLAVAPEGEMFLHELGSPAKPPQRKRLTALKLIEEGKATNPASGRKATLLRLTDKGWTWCQENLHAPITSTSPLSRSILQALLGILGRYFENQDQTPTFGQLIRQASALKPTEPLEVQVRRACLELGHGKENVRVRIADLREHLVGVARESLDEALLAMERARELSLYPLDNPREVTEADRAAVLYTPTGHARHIVYFGGRGS